jgi:hypothetical protein
MPCSSRLKSELGCPTPSAGSSQLAAIVARYKEECCLRSTAELESFADEPSLDAAIDRAGLARQPTGKRYSHQRRIPGEVLAAARRRLRRAHLSASGSFDDLYQRVQKAIRPIPGVGALMVYDSALRIGAKLKLTPARVYLHAGTRVGARALGLNWRADSIARTELPRVLRRLPPHQVEDLLCIFKNQLRSLAPEHGRRRPAKRQG